MVYSSVLWAMNGISAVVGVKGTGHICARASTALRTRKLFYIGKKKKKKPRTKMRIIFTPPSRVGLRCDVTSCSRIPPTTTEFRSYVTVPTLNQLSVSESSAF
jgi:hypothetical protein